MGGLLVSREVILAKTETTYGTDPTPTASANAILVRNVEMSPEGLRMVDRGAVRGSIGQLQKIYGGELRKIKFEVEMKGSGAAGTAPEVGPLLEACGMLETVVASTSVTYKPNSGLSTAVESVTIWYYEGGRKLHKFTGCRGTLSVSAEAGGILLAAMEFTGHYTQATDATQPTPTYNSQVPKPAIGQTISINGVSTLVVRSFSFDLGSVVESGASLAATDGYGDVIITKRDVTGQFQHEAELDSVVDIDALLAAGTRFAFSCGTFGSTAGNRITVSTPASSTYITNTSQAEGNGIRLRTVNLAVDDSTSDQELSLAFT